MAPAFAPPRPASRHAPCRQAACQPACGNEGSCKIIHEPFTRSWARELEAFYDIAPPSSMLLCALCRDSLRIRLINFKRLLPPRPLRCQKKPKTGKSARLARALASPWDQNPQANQEQRTKNAPPFPRRAAVHTYTHERHRSYFSGKTVGYKAADQNTRSVNHLHCSLVCSRSSTASVSDLLWGLTIQVANTYPFKMTPKQKRDDTLGMAAHEVGHALVTLHYGSRSSTVMLWMTPGYDRPDFPESIKYVSGKNLSEHHAWSPMEIAAVGYAGKIAERMYFDQHAEMDPDTFWKEINEPETFWSDEDRALINYVPQEHRREAFGRAYTFLNNNFASIKRYTDWITEDFTNNEHKERHYIISSISFVNPVAKTVAS